MAKTGLTGMDLVRLALSRCKTADEALELVGFRRCFASRAMGFLSGGDVRRSASTPGAASEVWAEHREAVLAWADAAAHVRPTRRDATQRDALFDAYWRDQSLRDGLRAGAGPGSTSAGSGSGSARRRTTAPRG